MHESKNLVFTIVFSALIFFLWQYYYVAPRIEEIKKQQTVSKELSIKEDTTVKNELVDRNTALGTSPRIKINASRLHGSINLKGARFDDITLAGYKETLRPDSSEITLLSPNNTQNLYFAEFGWVSDNSTVILPSSETLWQTNQAELTKDKPVTLTYNNGQGIIFIIEVAIDDNYMFTIKRSVQNNSNLEVKLYPFGVLSRASVTDAHNFAILHEGVLGVFDGILNEKNWSDIRKAKTWSVKSNNSSPSQSWFGFSDKYWLAAIIPNANSNFTSKFTNFNSKGLERFQADYIGDQIKLEKGKSDSITENFFVGAKEVSLLDSYVKNMNISLFDRSVDFGSLYFITKPLFKLLTIFHKIFENFGIAILLLTVFVKLLMFPLANKSYTSMNQLKKLQPKVKELQERYKENKLECNKAIMQMYKQEKVNPMSGCLPLLIQIPVFFALYKVLFVTIEMRHAPFFGWIHDLSAPDYTNLFNLFGLIAWNPPTALHIGAWPLIMAVTMYIQQELNPAPTDPVQAKVMKFLPVIFLFMFASFPAGLVIYWAWNNILSIMQQVYLMRKSK